MHGWTSRQRNAAIASFLSWTLDAFDFFLLVFYWSDIAHSFHVDLEEVTLAILLTLAVRPVGALIFGRAAEKFGRKPILMLNIVFFSAFELLSAAAPSLMLFFPAAGAVRRGDGRDLGRGLFAGDGDDPPTARAA